MSWELAAWLLLGGSTVLIFLGLPVAFGFLVINLVGAWLYLGGEPGLVQLARSSVVSVSSAALTPIPLFVLMGYVMERGALVDKMFHSVQLAFRRLPGSLAVATLVICTFWGIASGLVGAVVVLMGVIAMRPMLNAGYDTRLAAGVITAGGTLGILIPPSITMVVYAVAADASIIRIFLAGFAPGLLLMALFSLSL